MFIKNDDDRVLLNLQNVDYFRIRACDFSTYEVVASFREKEFILAILETEREADQYLTNLQSICNVDDMEEKKMKVDIEDIKKELDCYVAQLEDELENSGLPDETDILDAIERACIGAKRKLDLLTWCEQRLDDRKKDKKDCDSL